MEGHRRHANSVAEPFGWRDTRDIPLRTDDEQRRYTVTDDNPAVGTLPRRSNGPIASEPERWKLPLIDTASWIGRMPPPRDWTVEGWLARRTTGGLFGEDGVGKSLLAQQLATAVAAGKPFVGLKTTQSAALYLTCEDDELSLWQRQRSINKALGLPLEAAPAMLSTLVGYLAAELGQFDEDGVFVPGPMFHAIADVAKDRSAGLIVLDNIAHLFPGNEIIRRQVVAFLAACDQLAASCNASVLLLGHPAKAAGSEYSGNLGWSAHVRQRWFLTWGDPELGDTDARVLKKAKANLSKKGEEVAFWWQDWAFVTRDDIGADRARQFDEIARHNLENEAFLTCLRERNRQRRPVSEAKASRTYGPKEFALMPEAKGFNAHRLEGAMDRLFRIGAIERGFLFREDGKDKTGLREVSADYANDPADLPADVPRTPADDTR